MGRLPNPRLTFVMPIARWEDYTTLWLTFVMPTARWEDYPIAYLCYAHSQMGSMLVEAVG